MKEKKDAPERLPNRRGQKCESLFPGAFLPKAYRLVKVCATHCGPAVHQFTLTAEHEAAGLSKLRGTV